MQFVRWSSLEGWFPRQLDRAVGSRVEANRDGSMRHTLSTEDEEWISDGAFDLLVPLLGSDGAVLGLICLGQKRSELLFSGEERQLLSAIASSAAATLEGRNWSLTVTESANEHAMECLECKTLHDPASRLCPACGDNLIPAGVPYVLLAKFRLTVGWEREEWVWFIEPST